LQILLGEARYFSYIHGMNWDKKYLEMGSKGKKYIVTRTHKEGIETFKCNCPATSYRPWLAACKHIKRLKEKLRLP